MKELHQKILEGILKKHKDTLAVLIHGSSINGKLENYSDIDLNIFISGKPESPIENEIIEFEGKKILVNLNIENYKRSLDSAKNENMAEQLLVNFTALSKIKVLYDKNKFISKLIKETKKRFEGFRENQSRLLTIKFNVMIDFFFKIQRAYNKKDNLGMVYASKTIASQSIRIIQFFNKIKPEEMYNSILSNYSKVFQLKNTPKHFKEDFMICIGLKEKITYNQIYLSGIRIVKETIEFLNKQNLKEIKSKEFFRLLEQSKLLMK